MPEETSHQVQMLEAIIGVFCKHGGLKTLGINTGLIAKESGFSSEEVKSAIASAGGNGLDSNWDR